MKENWATTFIFVGIVSLMFAIGAGLVFVKNDSSAYRVMTENKEKYDKQITDLSNRLFIEKFPNQSMIKGGVAKKITMVCKIYKDGSIGDMYEDWHWVYYRRNGKEVYIDVYGIGQYERLEVSYDKNNNVVKYERNLMNQYEPLSISEGTKYYAEAMEIYRTNEIRKTQVWDVTNQ